QDATLDAVGARFGFSSTDVGFRGYALESPAGFDEKLLTIGEFRLGLGTRSLISDTKSVGEFVLEDVKLTLVQRGTENNLMPVLRHLEGLVVDGAGAGADGGAGSEEGDGAGSAADPGPRLRVGKIRVEGVGARLVLDGIPGIAALDQTFEIPAYEADFADAMGDDGLTVAEIAGLLVTDLKERALGAAGEHVPAPVLAALKKTLDGGLDGGLGGALDAGRAVLEAEADALKAEAQDRLEGAKGELDAKTDELRQKAGSAVDGALKEVNKKADGLLKGVLGGDGR
ncbi:MAG: hypothetical protein AAFP86_23425, partial [Planctomycetota bacterium]